MSCAICKEKAEYRSKESKLVYCKYHALMLASGSSKIKLEKLE